MRSLFYRIRIFWNYKTVSEEEINLSKLHWLIELNRWNFYEVENTNKSFSKFSVTHRITSKGTKKKQMKRNKIQRNIHKSELDSELFGEDVFKPASLASIIHHGIPLVLIIPRQIHPARQTFCLSFNFRFIVTSFFLFLSVYIDTPRRYISRSTTCGWLC